MAMQTIGSSSTTRTRVMLAPEPGYVGSPVLKPLNRIASESPYFGFESKLQARPHCKMQTTIEELWATFSPGYRRTPAMAESLSQHVEACSLNLLMTSFCPVAPTPHSRRRPEWRHICGEARPPTDIRLSRRAMWLA